MQEHLMFFSGWYGYAMIACAILISVSYQAIPNGLAVIEGYDKREYDSTFLVGVTSSPVFRAFIRLCGINHFVMALLMFSNAQGWIVVNGFWQTLMLCGEGAVAFISVTAAILIWRVRWFLLRRQ